MNQFLHTSVFRQSVHGQFLFFFNHIITFVVKLFTFGKTYFHFGITFYKKHFQRNYGIPVFFYFLADFEDFFFRKSKHSDPFYLVVVSAAVFIGGNVAVIQKYFAVFYSAKTVFQIYGVISDGFNFSSGQNNTRNIFVKYIVVVKCFSVGCYYFSIHNRIITQSFYLSEYKKHLQT